MQDYGIRVLKPFFTAIQFDVNTVVFLQGIYDRIVVQDVIKEIAQSNPLHAGEGRGFKV
jgi:hypothetical protein